MSEPSAVYRMAISGGTIQRDVIPTELSREELPPVLLDYLLERRRAIITELRMIEQMLNMRPSIPLRDRPH